MRVSHWPELNTVFAGRRILVTGATGYVGKVWVAWMLDHFEAIEQLVLLIRPNREHTASERFEILVATSPVFRPLRAKHGDHLAAFISARVQVITADISLPFAGLETGDVSHLIGQVDSVLHFAGLTDFNPDPLRALSINAEGPNHLANLAVHLGAPMAHVSTCYVAGRFDGVYDEAINTFQSPSGRPLDPRTEIDSLATLLTAPDDSGRPPRRVARMDLALARARELGWPNIYTYTKSLGEQLLNTRTDLTHITLRPAIVECARNYPFSGWNEGINTAGPIVALMSTWFRNLPSKPQNHFDVIPVDTVVRGCTLALAALLQGKHQAVYQLACSDHNPYTFGQVVDYNGLAVKRYLRLHGGDALAKFSAFTDGVNAHWGDTGALEPIRTLNTKLRNWVKTISPSAVPAPVAALMGHDVDGTLNNVERACNRLDKKLRRIDELLELYKPFIWDTHWTFRTDNIRSLSKRLHPNDQAVHRFDTDDIVWREYWINVEYMGLAKWCFPLLNGETVPEDVAPVLSLSLAPPEKLGKTA
jgi:nucleoside-diphosphate-sugar epimerase